MSVATTLYTTGVVQLPDVGVLAYASSVSIAFSSLFRSKVSWKVVPDLAGRTTKWVELSITAEGYVTLNRTDLTIDAAMESIRRGLSRYAGTLSYRGKGFGQLVVNPPGGGGVRDLNYGPKTELLDFQPLGAARSALVSWKVTTWISEYDLQTTLQVGGPGGAPGGRGPLLQLNEETSNTYDEDCFSTFAVRGTLEIPMTRKSWDSRIITQTVDQYRKRFLDFANDVQVGIDLTRFRVARRNFSVGRDKRVCDWEFVLEEVPFMPLPPGCPTARGSFTFRNGVPVGNRNAKAALGMIAWDCSLSCTYTVAASLPRRLAWDAFLSLLQWRMCWAAFGYVPRVDDPATANQNPGPPALPQALQQDINDANPGQDALSVYRRVLARQQRVVAANAPRARARAWLYHFGGREGVYLDSRTMTFEASWKVMTSLTHVLIATGLWRWPGGTLGGNLWAQSVKDITGWKGNLANVLNPAADAIVDMGGG